MGMPFRAFQAVVCLSFLSISTLANTLLPLKKGCPAPPKPEAKTCKLASDQAAGFFPPAKKFPVVIGVDSRFTSEQLSSIKRAAEEWNRYSRKILGFDFFKLLAKPQKNYSRYAVGINYCTLDKPRDIPDLLIVREDTESGWKKLGYSESVPAVTVRCDSAQLMLINAGFHRNLSQVQTWALHELGHSLGLNHSCRPNGKTRGYRGCKGLKITHPYHEAVMYPTISTLESTWSLAYKESLRENDQDRIFCLYQSRRAHP